MAELQGVSDAYLQARSCRGSRTSAQGVQAQDVCLSVDLPALVRP